MNAIDVAFTKHASSGHLWTHRSSEKNTRSLAVIVVGLLLAQARFGRSACRNKRISRVRRAAVSSPGQCVFSFLLMYDVIARVLALLGLEIYVDNSLGDFRQIGLYTVCI